MDIYQRAEGERILKEAQQFLGKTAEPDRKYKVKSPNGPTSDGLFAAIKDAGYDRISNPAVTVDFKTATFDGTASDFNVAARSSAALGYDDRFLHPVLRVEADLPPDATSVTSFRQATRTLAATADMIRAIAATTAKPETDTEVEAVNVPLKQIATISSGIPNVFLRIPSCVSTSTRIFVSRTRGLSMHTCSLRSRQRHRRLARTTPLRSCSLQKS